MATIYSDVSGNIVTFLGSYALEQSVSTIDPSLSGTVSFDEVTNPGLTRALNSNMARFSVSGSVLMSGGTQITPNPPGLKYQDRQSLASLWQVLKSDQSITAAQLRQILRFILRILYQDS